MNCPKCLAANADDAEFCSLCFERFGAAPARARTSVHDPDVYVCFDSTGAKANAEMIVADDGFFFLFDDESRRSVAEKGVELEARVSELDDEDKVLLKRVAPSRVFYFYVPKDELVSTKFFAAGTLELKAAEFSLGIGGGLFGLRTREQVEGFLKAHGFPVE